MGYMSEADGFYQEKILALEKELSEERSRADENFTALERIKRKWEITCNDLKEERFTSTLLQHTIDRMAADIEHDIEMRANLLDLTERDRDAARGGVIALTAVLQPFMAAADRLKGNQDGSWHVGAGIIVSDLLAVRDVLSTNPGVEGFLNQIRQTEREKVFDEIDAKISLNAQVDGNLCITASELEQLRKK